MNQDFDKIESLIIEELKNFLSEVEEKKYQGDKIWTYRLKQRLGNLGTQLGHKVAVGGFVDIFEKEWLYDVVWYDEDDKNRLVRIPLIVESEWDRNYSGIKYDFEKLLVGNAERRLMICQGRTEAIDVLFQNFEDAINVFEENYGDRFLIAILDSKSEDEFHFRTFTKQRN